MNCNDCGGFLPNGCECDPFGGRRRAAPLPQAGAQAQGDYEARMRAYLSARGVPPQIIEKNIAIARADAASPEAPTPEKLARMPLSEELLHAMRSAAKSDPRCVEQHWFVLYARAIEAHHGVTQEPTA